MQEKDEVIIRPSDRIILGYASTVGRRKTMEDTMFLYGNANSSGQQVELIGIFDGHDGSDVAEAASELFPWKLETKFRKPRDDNKGCIKQVFTSVNNEIKQKEIRGGTTALIGVCIDHKCYIANLGDCRCVIGADGESQRITTDHSPGNPRERVRIIRAGGDVTTQYTKQGILKNII